MTTDPMPPKPSLFAHMNGLDWLLVLIFTGLLAYIAALFLPVYGWPLGAIAALALLYLAKVRRDEAYAAAEAEKTAPPAEDHSNEAK